MLENAQIFCKFVRKKYKVVLKKCKGINEVLDYAK